MRILPTSSTINMERLRELLWSMAEDKLYRKTIRLELEFKIHEDYLEASIRKLL